MSQKNGVCCLFAYGLRFAERTAVMLHSLRRHWPGPVCLFVDKDTQDVGRRIAEDPNIRAEVKQIERFEGCRHAAYVTKTMLPELSPYDHTVLIDADTTIHGNLDELFSEPLVLTRFAEWLSTGRRISGRINWWKGKSAMIDLMVGIQLAKNWPAINTGVLGWWREHEDGRWLRLWHELTLANQGTHMTDEIAMQLMIGIIHPAYRVVIDDRWNWSPMYSTPKPDVRVIHYHGDKEWRKGQGRTWWEPELRRAVQANIGGIREWLGKWNKFTLNLKPEQFL